MGNPPAEAPGDAAEDGTAGRGRGGITDRQGPPRWPGRPARSRGPAGRPRWVCGPHRTLSCSSHPARAFSSSPAPERGLALPFPRAEALAPGPTLPRASARVPSSRPPAQKAGFSLLPTWSRGRLWPAWAAPAQTPQQGDAWVWVPGHRPPLPGIPRAFPLGGLPPGGIGPADLAACPQGSWESLPAAGSPRGGHCSSRAQLHIQLQEARAALSLSHRVGGGEDRGCEGAHLPTCRGAASAQ